MTPCETTTILTKADLDAIAKSVNEQWRCNQFTPEEVTFVRDLIALLKETRSTAMKILISTFVAALFGALMIGVKASLNK